MAERVVSEKLTRDEAAAAVRQKTGRAGGGTRSGRIEIRLDSGRKVTFSGLSDEGPADDRHSLEAGVISRSGIY